MVIKDLLLLQPKMAAISNRSGHYPLNISILNQQNFITSKIIFDSAPSIGRKFDAINGLLPFMSAAVGEWEDDIDQTSTVYYLLQEDPVLIKSYIEGLN